jgi:hypothetical protein
LRKIVESALQQSQDNLDAARKIESEAAARFGGRFNSIVSNSEFAYVNILMDLKCLYFHKYCFRLIGMENGIVNCVSTTGTRSLGRTNGGLMINCAHEAISCLYMILLFVGVYTFKLPKLDFYVISFNITVKPLILVHGLLLFGAQK